MTAPVLCLPDFVGRDVVHTMRYTDFVYTKKLPENFREVFSIYITYQISIRRLYNPLLS